MINLGLFAREKSFKKGMVFIWRKWYKGKKGIINSFFLPILCVKIVNLVKRRPTFLKITVNGRARNAWFKYNCEEVISDPCDSASSLFLLPHLLLQGFISWRSNINPKKKNTKQKPNEKENYLIKLTLFMTLSLTGRRRRKKKKKKKLSVVRSNNIRSLHY